MLRKIIVPILIVIIYVLQTTLAPAISMANAVPNFAIVFVCIYGLLRGRKEGLFVGFFMGLLLDLFFGYNDIIGINAFAYMVIGYISGIFSNIFFMDDINIPMIFVAISDFCYNFLYYVFTFLLRNDLSIVFYIKKIIIPEMVYSVVVCLFTYRILRYCNNRLEEFENRGENKDDI